MVLILSNLHGSMLSTIVLQCKEQELAQWLCTCHAGTLLCCVVNVNPGGANGASAAAAWRKMCGAQTARSLSTEPSAAAMCACCGQFCSPMPSTTTILAMYRQALGPRAIRLCPALPFLLYVCLSIKTKSALGDGFLADNAAQLPKVSSCFEILHFDLLSLI